MKVEILGVKIDPVDFGQALEKVKGFLKDGKKHYIVTPNPEIVMLAQKDVQLRKILNSADLAIPDGVGLIWASRMLAGRVSSIKYQVSSILAERVTGVDLMEKLCQMSAKKGLTVGLLGGFGNLAEKCTKILAKKFSNLRPLVFKENKPIDKNLDILFVAFGAPKQEKWIAKNLDKIPVKVAMGVGGAFEIIAGLQKRAPTFIQKLGLEWFWRLTTQPWRIKRQLALLVFVYLVIRQKLKGIEVWS